MAERTIIRQVPNAVLYSDGTIKYSNVQLLYPKLFKPEPFGGKKAKPDAVPKYSTQWRMPKETHRAAAIDLTKNFMQQLLTENKQKGLPPERKFLRNGDDLMKDFSEGYFVGSASETVDSPPSVRGRDKSLLTGKPEDLRLFYSGTVANILIRPWYQDSTEWGKRINAGLVAVQYVAKGERISSKGVSEQDIDDTFDEIEGEEEEAVDDDADGL